jgi:anti-sigma factor RsiW
MKNTEQLLDLQAYVDGELSEERRRQVEAALPADLDAQELVAGLRQLGTLIRAHEPEAKVPASREFYWNQIRRQIEAEQPKAPAASVVGLHERLVQRRAGEEPLRHKGESKWKELKRKSSSQRSTRCSRPPV